VTLLVGLVSSCGASTTGGREGADRTEEALDEAAGARPTSRASSTDEVGAGAVASEDGSSAGATPDGPGAQPSPPAPTACPAGMALVDGVYCTELEVQCLEQFYAPQNHLWVCKRVAEPTRCVGETRKVRYCIDEYEFPNRKGQRPMVMQNFYQAQVHCEKLGKRVCTESEWTKACEGPDNKPFPYGYVRDPEKCNGDKPYKFPSRDKVLNRDPAELERLWQGRVSGASPGCVSDYGVHDLPGNADELAASETYFPHKPKSNYDNVTTGGPWYFGVRNMCRPKIYSHDESFAYYYLSWRCCAEADGRVTDPRSPKQIARGWTFERVRQIALHSWKLPLNPLWPGDEGYSSSGPKR
jgi:hypothetical protein